MPEVESIPNNALARFDKYGLPGLVIAVLFIFNGFMTYYGFALVANNTKAMSAVESALKDFGQKLENRK
jgi:hypothetical protein